MQLKHGHEYSINKLVVDNCLNLFSTVSITVCKPCMGHEVVSAIMLVCYIVYNNN